MEIKVSYRDKEIAVKITNFQLTRVDRLYNIFHDVDGVGCGVAHSFTGTVDVTIGFIFKDTSTYSVQRTIPGPWVWADDLDDSYSEEIQAAVDKFEGDHFKLLSDFRDEEL